MKIFGYTIVETRELHQHFIEKAKHDTEIKQLKDKIAELENKVDNQLLLIKDTTYAKNCAQHDRTLAENQYQKVRKENRHLEAEIKRIKEHR